MTQEEEKIVSKIIDVVHLVNKLQAEIDSLTRENEFLRELLKGQKIENPIIP